MGVLSRDLVRWIKRTTRRHPDLGLRTAAVLGAAFGPGSEWAPSADELRLVFPEVDARLAQRRIVANLLRDLALGSLGNRVGSAALTDRVRVEGADHLLEPVRAGRPVVVIHGHVGARRASALAVEKLEIPARYAAGEKRPKRIGSVVWEEVRDAASAGAFLRNALEDLERGVVPLLAVDHSHGAGPRCSYLDRQVRVGRGVATLARKGAVVVPIRGTWIGWSARIEVTVLPPLPTLAADSTGEEELAFLQECVGWLDRYQRAHPEESDPAEVRYLSSLPRAPVA